MQLTWPAIWKAKDAWNNSVDYCCTNILKFWWHHATFLFCFVLIFLVHISSVAFEEVLAYLLLASNSKLNKKNLVRMPSRELNSSLPYNKPTHYRYQLINAASFWATPHPNEQRCALLRNAAAYWAAPLHAAQRRTLLNNAAPFIATPHPFCTLH